MAAFGVSAARSGGGHFGDRLGVQQSDSRSTRSSVLDRKLHPNPRFAHVTGRLDTGSTVPKVKLLSARAYLKRKDESFYRISAVQLADLLSEQQEQHLPPSSNVSAPNSNAGDGPRLSPVKGYQPMLVQYGENDTPANEQSFLIVDVREAREFMQVGGKLSTLFSSTLNRVLQCLAPHEVHIIIMCAAVESVYLSISKLENLVCYVYALILACGLQGRITEAHNVPAMMLRQDRGANELFAFKNREVK